jgi:hypothetical protein
VSAQPILFIEEAISPAMKDKPDPQPQRSEDIQAEPPRQPLAGSREKMRAERTCSRCGAPMEEGFLYNIDSYGEAGAQTFQQVGWMAGNEFKCANPEAWIFKGGIVNQRHKLSAWRCTSCATVELAAV